jgi:hypothetical protein
MNNPKWRGGDWLADDPLTVRDHLSYHWHRVRLKFSKKYRDEEARLEELIRGIL